MDIKELDKHQLNAYYIAQGKFKKKRYWYTTREENDDKYHLFCMRKVPKYDDIDEMYIQNKLTYGPRIFNKLLYKNDHITIIYWSNFNRQQYWIELINSNKLFKEFRACELGICVPFHYFDYGFCEVAALSGDNENITKDEIYNVYTKWMKEEYINGKPTYKKYFKELKLLVNNILNYICKSRNDWNQIVISYL